MSNSLIGIYSALLRVEIAAFHPLRHRRRDSSLWLSIAAFSLAIVPSGAKAPRGKSSPFDGRLLAATLLSGARTFLPCVNKVDIRATTRPTLLNYKRPPRFMALLTSLSASLFFALSICLISTFLNPDIR